MYNKITICNRALRLIKQKSISSLEEKTKEAQQCAFLYPIIKGEVLSSYIWKAAIKSIYLKALYNANSKLDYQYKFLLPNNVLRVLSVNGEKNFIKEGRALYSNSENIDILYIADINEEDLNSYIAYLIAIKLAIELAYDLSDDNTLLSRLYSLYKLEFNQATNFDSQEGRGILEEEKEEGSWISARNI